MSQVNSKTGALNLDHQDQIGLQTSTVFEIKMNCFALSSNLNCALIYWFQAGGGLGIGLGLGWETPVFCECKRGLVIKLLFSREGDSHSRTHPSIALHPH